MEVKKAEPRDIKAADGTPLDLTAFPGALTLVPGQLTANALAVNASGLTAGLSAAAAAGSIPGMYPAVQAAQAWSQPAHGGYYICTMICCSQLNVHGG